MRFSSRAMAALGLTFPLLILGANAQAGDDGVSPRVDAAAEPTLAQATVQRSEELTPLLSLSNAGKLVVDESQGVVTIFWHGEPPKEVVDELGTNARGVVVQLESARFSMTQITAGMNKARAAAPSPAAVVAIEPTEALDGIVVYQMGAMTQRRSEGLETSMAESAGMPVTLVMQAGERLPLASRQNDSAPWQGGGRLNMTASGNRCTAGFTVVKPDGTGRILTAGHCSWNGSSNVNDGAGDQIATGANTTVKKDYDSLLIDPTGGTIGEMYRGPQDALGSNEAVVSGSSGPVQGSSVCMSGAATGEHCSLEIGNTGVQFTCGAINDPRTCTGFVVKHTSGGVAGGTGDSGGGVYIVRADGSLGARGILSEGNSNFVRSCNSNVWGNPTCTSRFWAVSTETLKDQWNVVMDVE